MLASSAGLRVDRPKGVSVTAKPLVAAACTVVPVAINPGASGNAAVPANAALLVHVFPEKAALAPELTSFTTTEFGRTPVNVLLTKSAFTESETNPFGVIRQEQQEISCSSGEKA